MFSAILNASVSLSLVDFDGMLVFIQLAAWGGVAFFPKSVQCKPISLAILIATSQFRGCILRRHIASLWCDECYLPIQIHKRKKKKNWSHFILGGLMYLLLNS